MCVFFMCVWIHRQEGLSASSFSNDSVRRGARVLMQGHYTGELWGLAPHPTDSELFATVGDDKPAPQRALASAARR